MAAALGGRPATDHLRAAIGLPATPAEAAEVKTVVAPSWMVAGPVMTDVATPGCTPRTENSAMS